MAKSDDTPIELKTADREAPLPLKENTNSEEDEHRASHKFSFRSDPADAASPTYSDRVYSLTGNEKPRQVLEWIDKVRKVYDLVPIAAAPARHSVTTNLMTAHLAGGFTRGCDEWRTIRLNISRNNAERTWVAANPLGAHPTQAERTAHANGIRQARAAEVAGPYTAIDIEYGLRKVVSVVLPTKIVTIQKSAMRRNMKKPRDMKIRKYFNRLLHINNVELPQCPPYSTANPNQHCFSDEELADILVNSVPNKWKSEMEKHGVNQFDNSHIHIIDFFERMEHAETLEGNGNGNGNGHSKKTNGHGKSNGNGKSNHGKKNGNGNGKSHGGCLVHGPNANHTSDECNTLKAEAKRIKDNNGNGKKTYPNKTWKKGNGNGNGNGKSNEVNAFVKKKIKAGIKKALAGKRKKSDDDSSAGSLNAFDIDIDQFNEAELDTFDPSDVDLTGLDLDTDDSEKSL